ncbi:hypothetical protein E2320_009477, partial [Naja naja]
SADKIIQKEEGGGRGRERERERGQQSWCKQERDSFGEPALKALGKHLIASWAAACFVLQTWRGAGRECKPSCNAGRREEDSGEAAEEGRKGSRRNRKQEEEEEAEAGIAGGGRTWNSVAANQLQAQLPENLCTLHVPALVFEGRNKLNEALTCR